MPLHLLLIRGRSVIERPGPGFRESANMCHMGLSPTTTIYDSTLLNCAIIF